MTYSRCCQKYCQIFSSGRSGRISAVPEITPARDMAKVRKVGATGRWPKQRTVGVTRESSAFEPDSVLLSLGRVQGVMAAGADDYEHISAMQNSVRSSNPDAAVC